MKKETNKKSSLKKWIISGVILLVVIIFVIQKNNDRNDNSKIFQEFNQYTSIYNQDVEQLTSISNQWNSVVNNHQNYDIQTYASKLDEIGNNYANTYEYYKAHKPALTNFIDTNKGVLEKNLVGFSAVDTKTKIQNEDISIQQNIRMMQDTVQTLIKQMEAQQQQTASLVDLGTKLLSLLIV